MLATPRGMAGVLDEDRADVLYHRYEGGGVTIDGPSVLVRKKFGENYAVSGNYYVDMVSSASIDVLSTASPYEERRVQKSAGLEYLRGKTTYTLNYVNSEESDYQADTAIASISEDMFGDLTTVTLGFSRGWDTVGKRGSPAFSAATDHRNYRIGLSQILTKRLIAGLNYEAVSDQGYLQNPYRSARFCADADCTVASTQEEVYPHTRSSNAISLSARYYLPYRASVNGSYRYYTDSWGILGHTAEIGYVHPLQKAWIFETSLRYYTQTRADFYSDLFPYRDAQNYLARDKELATFNSWTLHLGATYELPFDTRRWLQKSTINLFYDRVEYQYDDFRNALYRDVLPYEQPLYSYGANIYRLFFSVWF